MRIRQTHVWIFAGLMARIAPVSIVPLLIRIFDHSEVDWFVLVQTNASLLAVILSFSQANFIQQKFSEKNGGEIVLFTSAITIVISAVSILVVYLIFDKSKTYIYSIILGLSLACVPQAQAILRCAGLYLLSIVADFSRLFAFAILVGAIFFMRLPIEWGVFAMAIYYFFPFLIFAVSQVKALTFGEVPRAWRSAIPYLATVTSSLLVSAGVLAVLRYALLEYGQPGDLANYAAIFSVASLSAVVVDFIYVRLGQNIVVGARESDRRALISSARRIFFPVAIISAATMVVACGYAAIELPREDGSTVLASAIIVASFVLRAIYIFFQNMLVGLGNAKPDVVAALLGLAVATLLAPTLIEWRPLIGASISFLLISIIYVVVLGTAMFAIRSKP